MSDLRLTSVGPAISKRCLTRLQHQHNCVVRIVMNLRKFDHVSAHCTELGWLPVDTLIHYRTLCTKHQLYHRTSRLTVVNRGAKKKQAMHDKRVGYLQIAPL